MSDTDLLRTTLAQVLGEERDQRASVWQAFDDGGFSRISVPAAAGGSDGTVAQATAVLNTWGTSPGLIRAWRRCLPVCLAPRLERAKFEIQSPD
jgi:alkylation response protein AidB-like acyl-CoA dehydrogenase